MTSRNNFAQTTRILRISRPALSRRVQRLRRALNIDLFSQASQAIEPASTKLTCVRYTQQMLIRLTTNGQTLRSIGSLSHNALELTVTPAFVTCILNPLIHSCVTRFPGVHLRVFRLSVNSVRGKLISSSLSVTITFSRIEGTSVRSVPTFIRALNLVINHTRPLCSYRRTLAASRLTRLSFTLLAPSFTAHVYVSRCFAEIGVAPGIAVRIGSMGALLRIVQGATITAVLPRPVTARSHTLRGLTLISGTPRHNMSVLEQGGGCRDTTSITFVGLVLKSTTIS